MSQNTLRSFPNWIEEFIELFIQAPNYSNTIFAVGKDGDLHAIREGERKATLRELFSAIHSGIMKAKQIDTFTLEKLKSKCKTLIMKAKNRSKGRIGLLKYLRTFAAEIELKELEKEIKAQETKRFIQLTQKLSELTHPEICEYATLLVKFFKGRSEEELLLARKLIRNLPFIEVLLQQRPETRDFVKAWELICNTLYRDGKLLESLAGVSRFITLPVWAEQHLKDILKTEFKQKTKNQSFIKKPFGHLHIYSDLSIYEPPKPQGLAAQELVKSFEPEILESYIDLFAEAGAEVFVERKLPYFIPQGTLQKLYTIEKEIAKERILKSLKDDLKKYAKGA